MNMESKKRQRAPNFTSAESLLLCDLVEKYKNVLENKKTDGTSVAEKQKCWKMLTEKYNARTSYVARSCENLIAAYKNLKTKAKKQHSSEKMAISNIDIPGPSRSNATEEIIIESIEQNGEDWDMVSADVNMPPEECQTAFNTMVKKAQKSDTQYKKKISCTGGGPPPSPPNDPLLEKVKCLIGPGLEGMYTVFDSDADFMKQQQVLLPSAKQIEPIDGLEIDMKEELGTPQPKPCKRLKIIRKRLDPALDQCDTESDTGPHRKSKRKSVADSFRKLSESKQELVALQIQIAHEQLSHQRDMQELEKKQIMDRLQYERQKHEYEMKILKEKWEMELSKK